MLRGILFLLQQWQFYDKYFDFSSWFCFNTILQSLICTVSVVPGASGYDSSSDKIYFSSRWTSIAGSNATLSKTTWSITEKMRMVLIFVWSSLLRHFWLSTIYDKIYIQYISKSHMHSMILGNGCRHGNDSIAQSLMTSSHITKPNNHMARSILPFNESMCFIDAYLIKPEQLMFVQVRLILKKLRCLVLFWSNVNAIDMH